MIKTCPDCNGRGGHGLSHWKDCNTCIGSGYIEATPEEDMEVMKGSIVEMSLPDLWKAQCEAEAAYNQALDSLIERMTHLVRVAFKREAHEHVSHYATGLVHVGWYAFPVEFEQWEGTMKENKSLFHFNFPCNVPEQEIWDRFHVSLNLKEKS